MTINDVIKAAAEKYLGDGSTTAELEAKLDAMILLLEEIAANTAPVP